MDPAPPDSPSDPSPLPPGDEFDLGTFLRENSPDALLPVLEDNGGPRPSSPAPSLPQSVGSAAGNAPSKEALRKKRWRETLSPGRREGIKKREREQKKKRFRSLSEEGRAQHRRRDRIRKARERDAESPACREERLARERARKQALRARRGAGPTLQKAPSTPIDEVTPAPPVLAPTDQGLQSLESGGQTLSSPIDEALSPSLLSPLSKSIPAPLSRLTSPPPMVTEAYQDGDTGGASAPGPGSAPDGHSLQEADALLDDPFGLGDPLAEWRDGGGLDDEEGKNFVQQLFDSNNFFDDLL